MFNRLSRMLLPSRPQSIARAFARYGWIGFWLQIVLGILPIGLSIYVLFFCSSAPLQRTGMGMSEYLTLFGFLILLFTIFWSHRYTRLAKRIADPERRPPKSKVLNSLWIGLAASSVGILFSITLMTFEVGRLLFVFLDAPQGGVPVIQTQTYDPSRWVSAIDMVGLLADLSFLVAELVVLLLSLWLLFRVTTAIEFDSPETVHSNR